MSKPKKKCTFYGFEDYDVFQIASSFIYNVEVYVYRGICMILPIEAVNANHTWIHKLMHNYTDFIFEENRSLLNGAKTIYIHDDCDIPRELVYTKYKRCNSPSKADVCVLPSESLYFETQKFLVAINDIDKLVVVSDLTYADDRTNETIDNISLDCDMSLEDISKCGCFTSHTNMRWCKSVFKIPLSNISKAKIKGVFQCLVFNAKQGFVLDLCSGEMKRDKCVTEKMVMESLACDDSKLDFDNLMSIYDMLCSSDEATRAVGLKAMSVSDYVHFPISCRFIIKRAAMDNRIIRYDRAKSLTNIKFMYKTLRIGNESNIQFNESSIYRQDWKILRKLLARFYDNNFGGFHFLRMEDSGIITPVFKA